MKRERAEFQIDLRLSRMARAIALIEAISADRSPCLQAFLLPGAPVLFPPCSLHLPFAMAGHLHSVPRRVFAPHLGERFMGWTASFFVTPHPPR